MPGTKELTKWMLTKYKSTKSVPKNLQYTAWTNGLSEPGVGPGKLDYSRSLYTELVKNQISVTNIFTASTPICRRIQRTKSFVEEHFKNLKTWTVKPAEWWFWPRRYNQWGEVTKISDLFIKGLGGFNFVEIAEKINHQFDLNVSRIRQDGYFPKSKHHDGWLFNHKDTIEYLVKYWNVLKDHEHIDAIERNLQEFKQLKMPFMHIHPDKLNIEYGNIKFEWLQDVEFPGFTIPKDGKELELAAVEFNNCAKHYIGAVVRKQSIIMYNEHAMAEYTQHNGLGQVQPKNRLAHAADRKPFEAIEKEVLKLF